MRATGLCLIDGARLVSLESALWEATRPAFRVRYIHDPTSTPRVPLYASYGFATGIVRAVTVHRYSGPAIRIAAGALGHERPEQDLILPAETPILIRDWRAEALFGAREVVVPVERLADGESVAPVAVLSLRLYELRFDSPQVIYAEGLEIACAALGAADEPRLAAE